MIKSWCPLLPKNKSKEELEEALPGMASVPCQSFNDLPERASEQVIADLSWEDLININGQSIWYFVYGFDMEYAQKDIFGEDVLAPYKEPFQIKVYLDIKDVVPSLGPMGGYFADDTVTGYIHIKTFQKETKNLKFFEELKLRYEPKSKDLIQIIQFGCDRPGDRSANYYEVTSVDDQLISQNINMFYGHYVWKITLKRFAFACEPGAVLPNGELGNDQAYDNNKAGVPDDPLYPDKVYDFNIDKEGKEKIFNQDYKHQSDIYGGYYSLDE